MTSKREEAKFEKGSPYLPAEENSKFFTMEGRFWAELIDLVGLGGGHILLAVGVRYSMYVRHTCIQCIRWYGFVLRYLLEIWEEKIFICVPTTCPATGEEPLGLRWSIACCCVYSECSVVWLWVRWIRTSDGDGYGAYAVLLPLRWSEWGFGYGPSSRFVPYLTYCQRCWDESDDLLIYLRTGSSWWNIQKHILSRISRMYTSIVLDFGLASRWDVVSSFVATYFDLAILAISYLAYL